MSEPIKPQQEGQQPSPKKKDEPLLRPGKGSKSVATYLVILFVAAFVLLVMAYFMQQRADAQDQQPRSLAAPIHTVQTQTDMI